MSSVFGPFSSRRSTPGLVSRWCGGDREIVGTNNCRSESLNIATPVRGVFIWIERRHPWRTEDQRILGLGGSTGPRLSNVRLPEKIEACECVPRGSGWNGNGPRTNVPGGRVAAVSQDGKRIGRGRDRSDGGGGGALGSRLENRDKQRQTLA